MSEIDKIIKWSKEAPNRDVTIKSDNRRTQIYVFFGDILCGQFVEKLSDINKKKAYKNQKEFDERTKHLLEEEE